MKLRIARKVIAAVESGRYNERTLGRALRRYHKTKDSKEINRFWDELMSQISDVDRAGFAFSCDMHDWEAKHGATL